MKGFDLLGQLLATLKTGEAQGEFRLALEPRPAGRAIARPVALGRVLSETESGEEGTAKLGFTVYIPQGAGPETAEEFLDSLIAQIKSAAEPVEVERGTIGQDKLTGLLFGECRFLFQWGAGGQAPGQRLPITIGDWQARVTSWKLGINPTGDSFTAIGEELPFWIEPRAEYLLELKGLTGRPPEAGQENMEVVLPGQGGRLLGCRWKSFSSEGTAVLVGKGFAPAAPERRNDSGEPGQSGGAEQRD